jgi:HD-GYP domain-containing protein (c-di-GMP phosphodiesterase class II)
LIKKIAIEFLKPGMYIADLNNHWVPQGNASRSGLIKNPVVIDKIRKLGVRELYIDTEKGDDCQEGQQADAVKQLQTEQFESIAEQSGFKQKEHKKVSLHKERERAAKTYDHARNVIGNLLDDIKNKKAIDTKAVDETAAELISSLDANENALACVSFMRSKDEYLLEHSINVGLLLGVFGKFKRLPPDAIQQIVAGGILHDIGKVLVPIEILNKPGKLEADEWEEMKRHVTYGAQILDITDGLSELTRSICRLHHERLDGSGYPRNLPEGKISLEGRMSAICDVFDAITADRVYHVGMGPNEALKKLVEWSVFHLDKNLVYDFIRCLSVYPVGTLVELSNGRAGVIIQANKFEPTRPLVRIFYNTRQSIQVTPEVIDMTNNRGDLQIINTLDPRALNIDIQPFL